jgi:hypothetical protein
VTVSGKSPGQLRAEAQLRARRHRGLPTVSPAAAAAADVSRARAIVLADPRVAAALRLVDDQRQRAAALPRGQPGSPEWRHRAKALQRYWDALDGFAARSDGLFSAAGLHRQLAAPALPVLAVPADLPADPPTPSVWHTRSGVDRIAAQARDLGIAAVAFTDRAPAPGERARPLAQGTLWLAAAAIAEHLAGARSWAEADRLAASEHRYEPASARQARRRLRQRVLAGLT